MTAIALPTNSKPSQWIGLAVIGALIMLMGYRIPYPGRVSVPYPRTVSEAPGGDDGLGNFWFDASGGTCTRQSPAGAYIDGEACDTLQTAYAAASCGDVIRVVNADYSTGADQDQQLVEDASASACTGNPIVIRAQAGTIPDFRFIRLGDFVGNCASDGPDNLTFMSLRVVWGIDIEHDSTNIIIDDFGDPLQTFNGSWGMGGGDCAAPNNVPPDNITISNGIWGPCDNVGAGGADCRNQYTDSPAEGKNKISNGASNVLIDNNLIANWTMSDPEGPHFECIWVGGGNNVTIRKNHFYNCVTNCMALGGQASNTGQWLIENNWFGDPGSINACVKFGLNSGTPTQDFYIRFNSFGGTQASVGNEEGGSAGNRIHVIGNIMGHVYGCITGAIYEYNVIYGGDTGCGANDVEVTPAPYINSDGLGAANYHLSGSPGSTAADDLVPGSVANSGATEDYDGNPRSPPRDAGAHER